MPATTPVKGFPAPTTATFSVIGVQPTIEYKFSNNIVFAADVLFTPFGQNQIDAIYPTFTNYYWGSKGRAVLMR